MRSGGKRWHAFQCRLLLERSMFGLNELLEVTPDLRARSTVGPRAVGIGRTREDAAGNGLARRGAAASLLPREHAGAKRGQGNGASESRSAGLRERVQHNSMSEEPQVAGMRIRQENRSGLTPELSRHA